MAKSIVELLKKDHRTLETLFEKIEDSDEPEGKETLFEELREEFEAHAEGEEKVVYPELEKLEELEEKAEHAYEEHNEARELFNTIESLSPEDEKWESNLRKLKSTIEHHLEEEEGNIFPKMEQLLPKAKLTAMADAFESSKQDFAEAG